MSVTETQRQNLGINTKREENFKELLGEAYNRAVKIMLAGKFEALFELNEQVKSNLLIIEESEVQFAMPIDDQRHAFIYAGRTEIAICRNGNAIIRGKRADGSLQVIELIRDKGSRVKEIPAAISKAVVAAMPKPSINWLQHYVVKCCSYLEKVFGD